MRKKTDNIACEDTPYMKFAALSAVGDREGQEDSYAYDIKNDKAMITVCDGMGGHKGGKLASNTAVGYILEAYRQNIRDNDSIKMNQADNAEVYMKFLNDITLQADALVSNLKDLENNPLLAGATMVTVIIDGMNLFWSSVGDSRLYLMRDQEFIQVTVDHNYHEYLKEQLANQEITMEEYAKEDKNGEALLSYLGVNGLQVIDHNIKPFKLEKGDIIMIMSDGLYKVLSNEEIAKELIDNKDLDEITYKLNKKAEKKARKEKINRDNTTMALLEIQ